MLGGRALDVHAADRIDRDLRVLAGRTFMIAAATRSGGLGMIVLGVIMIGVMVVAVMIVLVAAMRIAGCGACCAVTVFATRIASAHFSIPLS
jgi:hypothetical protein